MLVLLVLLVRGGGDGGCRSLRVWVVVMMLEVTGVPLFDEDRLL